MNRIEVITSIERRRRWSRAEKERWVSALMEPGANASDIARQAGVDRGLLYRWRQQLAASRDPPSFIPIAVAPTLREFAPEPEPARSAAISIEFTTGVRVKIEGAPDPGTLAKVIGALAAERRR
jgi:transposase